MQYLFVFSPFRLSPCPSSSMVAIAVVTEQHNGPPSGAAHDLTAPNPLVLQCLALRDLSILSQRVRPVRHKSQNGATSTRVSLSLPTGTGAYKWSTRGGKADRDKATSQLLMILTWFTSPSRPSLIIAPSYPVLLSYPPTASPVTTRSTEVYDCSRLLPPISPFIPFSGFVLPSPRSRPRIRRLTLSSMGHALSSLKSRLFPSPPP